MAPSRRQKRTAPPATPAAPRWSVVAACVVALAVEVVFLPGAASPFRLVKEAVALGGLLLVAGFATAVMLRRGSQLLPRGPLAIVLAALPILQALSAAWSRHPHRAVEVAVATSIWILAMLWLATLEASDRNRITLWAATGAALSAAYMLLQAAGGHWLSATAPQPGDRGLLFGLTGNPADLAMATALLVPAVVALPAREVGVWRQRVIVGLLAAGVVVSQTFTGYAALAALALVYLVRQRSRTLWLIAAGGAAALLAIALAAGLGARLDKQVKRIQRGDWYFLLSARSDGWTATAEMVRDHPWTGVGAGGFTVEYYPSRLAWLERHREAGGRGETATHFAWSHSDPAQLVAELGVAGWAWLLALALALLRAGGLRDPVVAPTLLALAPFALLHYPFHLAVGTLPVALVLPRLLANEPRGGGADAPGVTATATALLLVLASVAGAVWQVQRVALDVWRGAVEHALASLDQLDDARRAQVATAFEAQLQHRIVRSPTEAPWLWRIVGQVRRARGDARGAEIAFRTANTLWPHEEAEFNLGLALADEGRRSEAMIYLGRVCRTNPALVRLIPDPDLRRAVRDLVRARDESPLERE